MPKGPFGGGTGDNWLWTPFATDHSGAHDCNVLQLYTSEFPSSEFPFPFCLRLDGDSMFLARNVQYHMGNSAEQSQVHLKLKKDLHLESKTYYTCVIPIYIPVADPSEKEMQTEPVAQQITPR